MAGHSKFKNIMHRKGAQDKKRAKIFSRLGREISVSAKTGEGVPQLLDAVVERTPSPATDDNSPLQALVFDSHFDQYRGVVSSVSTYPL